tara:strand:- start:678 stop:839 length:162 start_codon:yes stop_codon:yes gene_type:complete
VKTSTSEFEQLSCLSLLDNFFLSIGEYKPREIELNKEEAQFLIEELTNFVKNK